VPAVIFDLDGVLIDSEELQYRAYGKVLAELGVEVTREEYAREWIAGGRGPEYIVAKHQLPLSAAELRARKDPVYHQILRDDVALMTAVMPALERLHRRFPLAVATNSNTADVGYVMRRFQLGRFFRAVITREMYENSKPAPDAFLAAAAMLGLPAAQCVVVEDSERGVVAAHRAGARCVAIPHPFTASHDFALADRVIGNLEDLTVELIEVMLGSQSAHGGR